ncbi:hypothetical protein BD289DRAFT_443992 [Coniella lustricola]|uniref:Secreted protein n=1 Tax=Coniella lustricola TaxID=2025994 RepID=A0A2T2ZWF6_9PEZI|nr:hypothetical protein BD289DRAFT_443992 [Coniella lustricola]
MMDLLLLVSQPLLLVSQLPCSAQNSALFPTPLVAHFCREISPYTLHMAINNNLSSNKPCNNSAMMQQRVVWNHVFGSSSCQLPLPRTSHCIDFFITERAAAQDEARACTHLLVRRSHSTALGTLYNSSGLGMRCECQRQT